MAQTNSTIMSYQPLRGLIFSGFATHPQNALHSITMQLTSAQTLAAEAASKTANTASSNAKQQLHAATLALAKLDIVQVPHPALAQISNGEENDVETLEVEKNQKSGSKVTHSGISFAEMAKRKRHGGGSTSNQTNKGNITGNSKGKKLPRHARHRQRARTQARVAAQKKARAKAKHEAEKRKKQMLQERATAQKAQDEALKTMKRINESAAIKRKEWLKCEKKDEAAGITVYFGLEYACGRGHRFIEHSNASSPNHMTIKTNAFAAEAYDASKGNILEPDNLTEKNGMAPRCIYSWPTQATALTVPCKCCHEILVNQQEQQRQSLIKGQAKEKSKNIKRKAGKDSHGKNSRNKVPDAVAQVFFEIQIMSQYIWC